MFDKKMKLNKIKIYIMEHQNYCFSVCSNVNTIDFIWPIKFNDIDQEYNELLRLINRGGPKTSSYIKRAIILANSLNIPCDLVVPKNNTELSYYNMYLIDHIELVKSMLLSELSKKINSGDSIFMISMMLLDNLIVELTTNMATKYYCYDGDIQIQLTGSRPIHYIIKNISNQSYADNGDVDISIYLNPDLNNETYDKLFNIIKNMIRYVTGKYLAMYQHIIMQTFKSGYVHINLNKSINLPAYYKFTHDNQSTFIENNISINKDVHGIVTYNEKNIDTKISHDVMKLHLSRITVNFDEVVLNHKYKIFPHVGLCDISIIHKLSTMAKPKYLHALYMQPKQINFNYI